MTKILGRQREVKATKNNGNGNKLGHEEFVKAWQGATNFSDFLASTNIDPVKAKSQSNYLRKKGVSLKFLAGMGRQRINVAQLNEIIANSTAN